MFPVQHKRRSEESLSPPSSKIMKVATAAAAAADLNGVNVSESLSLGATQKQRLQQMFCDAVARHQASDAAAARNAAAAVAGDVEARSSSGSDVEAQTIAGGSEPRSSSAAVEQELLAGDSVDTCEDDIDEDALLNDTESSSLTPAPTPALGTKSDTTVVVDKPHDTASMRETFESDACLLNNNSNNIEHSIDTSINLS